MNQARPRSLEDLRSDIKSANARAVRQAIADGAWHTVPILITFGACLLLIIRLMMENARRREAGLSAPPATANISAKTSGAELPRAKTPGAKLPAAKIAAARTPGATAANLWRANREDYPAAEHPAGRALESDTRQTSPIAAPPAAAARPIAPGKRYRVTTRERALPPPPTRKTRVFHLAPTHA